MSAQQGVHSLRQKDPRVVRQAFLLQQQTEQEQMKRDVDAFEENLTKLQQLTPRLNDTSRRCLTLTPPTGSFERIRAGSTSTTELSDEEIDAIFTLIDNSKSDGR